MNKENRSSLDRELFLEFIEWTAIDQIIGLCFSSLLCERITSQYITNKTTDWRKQTNMFRINRSLTAQMFSKDGTYSTW